jgi:hypothetical protein
MNFTVDQGQDQSPIENLIAIKSPQTVEIENENKTPSFLKIYFIILFEKKIKKNLLLDF